MPMKNANPQETAQIGLVSVKGRFRPNGSSAVDNTLNKGVGWSAARSGAGAFLVTFDEVGVELVEAGCKLMTAAGDDKEAQLGTYTAPTTTARATLALRVWDASAAAATDVASDADSWIHFHAEFQNTTKRVG